MMTKRFPSKALIINIARQMLTGTMKYRDGGGRERSADEFPVADEVREL